MEELLPPPITLFSDTLDKDKFTLTITMDALNVPVKQCSNITSYLKKDASRHFSKFSHLSVKPRIIQVCEKNPQNRIILLNNKDKLTDKDVKFLQEKEATFCKSEITLGYTNWTIAQIFRAIIPKEIKDVNIVSSFESIGHIAHLNLKDCLQKYKHIIGQVILDKCNHLKTVVNKVGTIHSEYRYFDMEVIAGKENFITTVIENKLKFKLDYSKVYWNSKLGTEHSRLVDVIQCGENVLDLFCGIGPFAIPLAKKRCNVFANDLNPISYFYLLENIRLNKIDTKYIHCFSKDAREYIKEFKGQIHHVIMNLPASAVEFLDMFQGLFKGSDRSTVPVVHCYHFADHATPEDDTVKAVEYKLGCVLDRYSTHLVRKISPTKWMVCISFWMPKSVLFGEVVAANIKELVESESTTIKQQTMLLCGEVSEPSLKKRKLSGASEENLINS